MGILADLLSPYRATVNGEPQPVPQTGMAGGLFSLMGLAAAPNGPEPGASFSSLSGPSGGYDQDASHWEEVAQKMADRKYGWGPDQFQYLDYIIAGGGPDNVVAESRWDPSAVNPAGAYGIPQMYAPAHPDVNVDQFMSDPRGQIKWLLNYVQSRYGDPYSAYQTKASTGIY